MSWWPFGKKSTPKDDETDEADEHRRHFKDALDEAFLRSDDLKDAVEKMKKARERRNKQVPSLRHNLPETHPSG